MPPNRSRFLVSSRSRLVCGVGAVVVALALVGCSGSVSIGGNSVSKSEVEKQAQAKLDALARTKGLAKFPPVTCTKDLEAKVGASERCSATFKDGTLGITVTVKSLSGGFANMHFQADSQLSK